MHRYSTSNPRAQHLEDELRSLRVRDPDPALRDRVLAMAAEGRGARWQWGVEVALAAGILLALGLTVMARAGSTIPAASAETGDSVVEACRALDSRPLDWECRRLAASLRASHAGVSSPFGAGAGVWALEGGMP